MTQEEKQLVLIDLSARWLYGVIVSPLDCGKAKVVGFKDKHPLLFDLILQKEYERPWEIEYIKPYLRPLSSMTEEETKEYKHLVAFSGSPNEAANFINWLNAHHFDYRTDDEGKTLIEKGLALIAPEGMYNDL